MRFLHTADWHLGKTLCNANLLDDQAHVLEQVLTMLQETRAEALVIAGDLFDRAVPSRETVDLLNQTLERMVRGLRVPVLIIAGNHDHPERLGVLGRNLGTQGLHVATLANPEFGPVIIGTTAFHLLPYADPAVFRQALQDEGVRTHQDALTAQMDRARHRHPEGCRFVAVAHVLVSGGEVCDSELGLALDGGVVAAATFQACDYAALGHLHRAQEAGFPQARYAGSLLKFSASEAAQVKSLTLVEIAPQGPVVTECLPFSPRRDLRCLRGRFEELVQGSPGNAEDYLFLELLDDELAPDAMVQLRQVYPNLLGIQPTPPLPAGAAQAAGVSPRDLDPERLFGTLFHELQGRDLSAEEAAIFREIAGRTLGSGDRT